MHVKSCNYGAIPTTARVAITPESPAAPSAVTIVPRRRVRPTLLPAVTVVGGVAIVAIYSARPLGARVGAARDAAAPSSFCSPADGSWSVAWRDEFDGDALDPSKWAVTLGADEGSMRAARGTADNVWVADGALVLRSRATPAGLFESGAVTTRGRAAWSGRARVCVRARLPAATTVGEGARAVANASRGLWPAHWLLPDDVCRADAYAPPDVAVPDLPPGASCWPDKGEIDIMEMINGDGITRVAYHYSSAYPAEPCARDDRNSWIAAETRLDGAADGSAPSAARWRDAWREYAVEIGADDELSDAARSDGGSVPVAFAVDGEPLPLAVTYLDGLLAEGLMPRRAHAPRFRDIAYYLVLNTAIGKDGTWSGAPDEHTAFPFHHYVDYVRVARPTPTVVVAK